MFYRKCTLFDILQVSQYFAGCTIWTGEKDTPIWRHTWPSKLCTQLKQLWNCHCYLHPKMQTCFSCQFQILWPLPDENNAHMTQMVAKRSMHRTSNKVYYTQVNTNGGYRNCNGVHTVKYVLVHVKSHLENGRGHKSTKRHFKLLFLVR